MPPLPDLQDAFVRALDFAEGARIAIYRGNVHANCGKALAGAYPIVRKIVGEAFFDAMAREYARAHLSQSGDLNRYGEQLARFLEAFPHAADLPYLPDVARMEWLAHRAHFAEDAPAFDAASVAALPADPRLRLSPGSELLQSAWPLGRIWTVHQHDYRGAFAIDLDAGPDRVLVYRPGWRARVLSLSPGDFAFLAAAVRGETLGAALEAGVGADAGFDPSTTHARWIDAQVITALV